MARIYLHHHQVTSRDVDGQGHANNLSYLRWMQDAAVAHSSVEGWTTKAYHARDWAWVVRSHQIEYRRPAFENDEVRVHTWIADMKKFTSLRKYKIIRNDGKLLATAETNWAFVILSTGKLIPIPEEVQLACELADDNPL